MFAHSRRVVLASFALALTVGISGGWLLQRSNWLSPEIAQDRGNEIAHAAYRAHDLYTSGIRHHSVEIRASEHHLLASWLSKRVGMASRIPNLDSFELRLIGGRLLPIGDEAAGQIMYESRRGDRYTLFVAPAATATPSAFRYETWDKAFCVYWIDGDLGYALIGPSQPDILKAVAASIYEQLSSELFPDSVQLLKQLPRIG